MKRIKNILVLILIFSSLSSYAQSAMDEDRFFYSPSADEEMKTITPGDSFSRKGIQYGVIFSPVYIYQDNDDGKLGSYILNARVWGKTYLWNNSFFYIRGKESYMGTTVKDGVYESIESDNVIDLDLAYISANFADNAFNISAGRKFYNIGTGLVLNGRGDGGEISWYGSFLSFNLLGLYTGLLQKDSNPYGLSDKDLADGAKRVFGGGTATLSFLNQNFYLFGLAQIDQGDEESTAKTRYNSRYYGGGLEGVVLQNASYFAEFVYETGESYLQGTDDTSTIAAYAANSGISYYFPVVLNPTLILQYAYGSGDKYRKDYTNSARPSGASGDDTGFIAFGSFNGGFALKPQLSNIHIYRAGLSVTPFSWADSRYIKNMSLSGKYSYYVKDKKESSINTAEGGLPEAFLGQGIDVSFRWQIFYDLSMYVNYGLFLPGDAYVSSAGSKTFVMSGVNFSF